MRYWAAVWYGHRRRLASSRADSAAQAAFYLAQPAQMAELRREMS